jgi:hypothetical protein
MVSSSNHWNYWKGLRYHEVVFDAIRHCMAPPPKPAKRKIGFLVEEKTAVYGRRSRDCISTFRDFRNVEVWRGRVVNL